MPCLPYKDDPDYERLFPQIQKENPMPCRYEDDNPGERLNKAAALNKTQEVLLCSACRALTALGYDFGSNPDLDTWWHAHEETDAKRRIAEARTKLELEQAIELAGTKTVAQMTPDEKKLLRRFNII
jgi:hypothetical protein